MPKKGVVLPLGATGEVDATHLYGPSAIYKDSFVWLYYTAQDPSYWRPALALSKDGINFVKKGVVLLWGANGEYDDSGVWACRVIYKDGFFWMYYTANDGVNYRIALAVSKDGINFIKKGVVIPIGAGGDVDDSYLAAPSVLVKDGYVWLYYGGHDGTGNYRMCLATSRDGINFTKKGVVIPWGSSGESDDAMTIAYGSVLYYAGYFWAYYCSYDGSKYRTNLAISKDGINFVKKGVILFEGASGEIDDNYPYSCFCLIRDGWFWLYYAANDGSNYRIALALSKDGINFS